MRPRRRERLRAPPEGPRRTWRADGSVGGAVGSMKSMRPSASKMRAGEWASPISIRETGTFLETACGPFDVWIVSGDTDSTVSVVFHPASPSVRTQR